jgi:hypothetical protein
VRFICLFLLPPDRLVRAGELADSADRPPVETAQPAVGTALWAVQFRNDHTAFVGSFARTKNVVGAYFYTEIAALTTVRVDDQLHEILLLVFTAQEKRYLYSLWEMPRLGEFLSPSARYVIHRYSLHRTGDLGVCFPPTHSASSDFLAGKRIRFFPQLLIASLCDCADLRKQIVSMCINPYHQRKMIQLDYPDRLRHPEIFPDHSTQLHP